MSVIERVVFDTNVVVSALLMPGSVPRRAFNKALTHATVLISLATAAELNDVLRRSRFDRYLQKMNVSNYWMAFSAKPSTLLEPS